MNRRSLFGRIVDRAFAKQAGERPDHFRAHLEPLEDRKLLSVSDAVVSSNWVDIGVGGGGYTGTDNTGSAVAIGDTMVYQGASAGGGEFLFISGAGAGGNVYGTDEFGTVTKGGHIDPNTGNLVIDHTFTSGVSRPGAALINDAIQNTNGSPNQTSFGITTQGQVDLFAGTYAESDIVIDRATRMYGNFAGTGASVIVPDVASSHTIDSNFATDPATANSNVAANTPNYLAEDFTAGTHDGIIIYSEHVSIANLTVDGNGNATVNANSGQSYNFQNGITTLYANQDGSAFNAEHYGSAISPVMLGKADPSHLNESAPDTLIENVVVQNTFWHGIAVSPRSNEGFESAVNGYTGNNSGSIVQFLEIDTSTVNNVGVGVAANDPTVASRIGILMSNNARDRQSTAPSGDDNGGVMAYDTVSNAMVGIETNVLGTWTKEDTDIQDATVLNAPLYGIATYGQDNTGFAFSPPPDGVRVNTINDTGLSLATITTYKTTGIYSNHSEDWLAGTSKSSTIAVSGAYYGVYDTNNPLVDPNGTEAGVILSLNMNLIGPGTTVAGSVGFIVTNSATYGTTNDSFTLFGGPITGYQTGMSFANSVTPTNNGPGFIINSAPIVSGNATGILVGTGYVSSGNESNTDPMIISGAGTIAPGFGNPGNAGQDTYVNSETGQTFPPPPGSITSNQSRPPKGTIVVAPHTTDTYGVQNLTMSANSGLNVTLANAGSGVLLTNFGATTTPLGGAAGTQLSGEVSGKYPAGHDWNPWHKSYTTIGTYLSWAGAAVQTGNGTLVVDGPNPTGAIWYDAGLANAVSIVGSARLQVVAKQDPVQAGKTEDKAFVVALRDTTGNTEGYSFPMSALNTLSYTTLSVSLDQPTLVVSNGDGAFNLAQIEGYWIGSDFDFTDGDGYGVNSVVNGVNTGVPNDNANNNDEVSFQLTSISTTSGTTSDQIVVGTFASALGGSFTANNGTVNLGGAALTGALATGASVSVGQKFTIVNNPGTTAIQGTFLGLPTSTPGSADNQIGMGGFLFSINYNDTTGGGHNVSLTQIAAGSPPVLDVNTATQNYSTSWTNSGAVNIATSGASLTDTETNLLNSLTVTISSPVAGDVLSLPASFYNTGLTTTPHINVIPYNATTGQLILTGSDTLADYLSLVKQITYNYTGALSAVGSSRTILSVANDGAQASTGTTTISTALTPVIDLNAPNQNYSTTWTNSGAVGLAPVPSITDAESSTLASMTVTLASPAAGDALSGSGSANVSISGVGTGTLVFTSTGSASLSEFQTDLGTVTYNNSSGGPQVLSRSVTVVANDGTALSNTATATVGINTPPVIKLNAPNTNYTTTFTGAGAVAIASNANATLTDGESTTLANMTVTLSTHVAGDTLSATPTGGITVTAYNSTTGVLLLSGTDTLANYTTVLKSVTYNNTSGGPALTTETVNVQDNDGTSASNVATTTINIQTAPIVELNGPAVNWTNPTAWPATDANVGEFHQALKISNSGTATIVTASSTLQSMTVTLSNPSTSNGDYLLGGGLGNITASQYNRTTGQVVFTGSDTPANYLSALNLLIYNNSNIGGQQKNSETITVTVNDGTHTSNTATATLSIVQAPAVKLNINSTNYSTIWTNGGAVPISGTGPAMGTGGTGNFPVPTITDAEAANLSSMTVSIASVAAGDVLTFNAVTGITGAYNSVTGVATFTGSTTLANYQTELASVKYNNTSGGPGSNRTITVVTNDGSLASTAATASITVNTTGTFNSLAVGEYLFYDHSTGFDNVIGPAAVASSDNRAIDPTKVPYLGTTHASGASVSGYTNGLNGVMIDLTPHSGTNNHASLTLANLANDFSFKVSNSSLTSAQFNNPAGFWTAAPAPNGMTVRLAGGAGGSDRVEITWADGAIKNQWLEVTAKASTDTGLGSPVTFFFGNLIGETGDSNSTNTAFVTGTDETDMRLYAGAAPNPVYQAYDVNKDRAVDANDQIAARTNPGSVRIPTIAPGNFAPDTGPSAGPSATTSVDTNSIPSGLAAMANSALSGGSPNVRLDWLASRLGSVNLNTGVAAQVFEALAQANTKATRTILVDVDQEADALGLDDSLLDSLLTDLGLE